MRKTLFFLFITVISTLFVSCAKDIVDLSASITGFVKDYNTSAFISNCQVSLSPTGQTVITNSDGAFQFQSLDPGAYSLTFQKAGYNDQSKTVNLVSGQDVDASVLLVAKSAFALSESSLDFGDLSELQMVTLFNNSDSQTTFKITNIPSWATITPNSGSVAAGGNATLNVKVNREIIEYGDYSHVLNVSYAGKTEGMLSLVLQLKKVPRSIPTVDIVSNVQSLTPNECKIDGEIKGTGGTQILSYGHVWSTSPDPSLEKNCPYTNLGTTIETGRFTSELKNLASNTKYYVKAYAKNGLGIGYSNAFEFVTPLNQNDGKAILGINEFWGCLATSTFIDGKIENYDDVKDEIKEYGILIGTNNDPSNKTSIYYEIDDDGIFSCLATGLKPNKNYYVRVYAQTTSGMVLSDVSSFVTRNANEFVIEEGVFTSEIPIEIKAGNYTEKFTYPFKAYSENSHIFINVKSSYGAVDASVTTNDVHYDSTVGKWCVEGNIRLDISGGIFRQGNIAWMVIFLNYNDIALFKVYK